MSTWTRVEDGLPEPGDERCVEVLVWGRRNTSHWKSPWAVWLAEYFGSDEGRGAWTDDREDDPLEVTHWMALPAPPE